MSVGSGRIHHMFGSCSASQVRVGFPGDLDLAELVWADPADWEPEVDPALDHGLDTDGWDTALLELVLEGITESEALAANPLIALNDCALVDLAGQAERDLRAATALGYRVAAELARRRPEPSGHPEERGLSAYALDEIALATGLARGAVRARVAEADALTGRHPRLLAALGAGLLPLPAVRRVLELTLLLDAEDCAEVETRLLNRLGRPDGLPLAEMTPAQLAALPTNTVIAVSTRASTTRVGRLVKDLVHRLDPAASTVREAHAKTQRELRLEPGSNGMAWLTLHLPEAAAWAAYQRTDALAHTLPDDPHDDRSMDAKRADVALGLLMAEPGGQPVPVNLEILVDHTGCEFGSATHGGLVAEAGRLGPVSASTIRDLLDLTDRSAGSASGAHAVPQPCPGQHVHDSEGPGPYQPPDRLRNAMKTRDRTCRFPGCNRPAAACELDHTLRYPDGPTCSCNLGDLCVHHHHLKHLAPGWTLDNHGNGHLTWTTPTGHTHDVTPDREPAQDARERDPEPHVGTDPDPPPF